MSIREIARRLNLSRHTTREAIRQKGLEPKSERSDKQTIDTELLRTLYAECDGRVQRVYERLTEEYGLEVGYSTVSRMLRELEISMPPRQRCDSKPDEPGAEMQHDTSPYVLNIGGQSTLVIASLLYLRYSKRRYLRFYRRFNRFQMKCFFHEALMFWAYIAPECIIDNTNLARLRGTGKNAVIVPEMEAFSKNYGFTFICHEKGHANRKAGEERSFWTIETNFFPGRTFSHMEDLNAQAFQWATVRMEHRAQTKAKIIPAKAFEHEQAFLQKLPSCLPPPYRSHERVTDQYGYAAFNGNYYWVPGSKRINVLLLEYAQTLKIYCRRVCLAEYPWSPEGTHGQRISPPGMPPSPYRPRNSKKPAEEEERRLRHISPIAGAYLDFCLRIKGLRRNHFLRELYALSCRMSEALLVRAMERALRYRVQSVETLERIAAFYANDGIPDLQGMEWNEDFQEREQYREGQLGEAPDLSIYDRMMKDDEDDDESPNEPSDQEPSDG